MVKAILDLLGTLVFVNLDNAIIRGKKNSYLINGKEAYDVSYYQYPNDNSSDSKQDAFRHAYFSLLNVKSFGLAFATEMGNAHEVSYTQSQVGINMDLFNNNVGLSAYVAPAAQGNIQYMLIVMGLMQNGSLRYIKNNVLTPTNQ